jgi:hypothetical protein
VRNRVLIAVGVIIAATAFWAFWLLPVGEGEYRDSPDGLWRAHVSAMSRGTLLGTRRQYVELSIERLVDGSTMWRREIPHTSADSVPPYGDRSARFISWSPDSTRFSVSTTNGATATLPVTAVKSAQPGGPANGSQPIRSETNGTSGTAGSRR